MRTRQYLLSTIREIPSDAEIMSHKFMLRSGMIRQVSSGIYTWLPTGLRVLRKVENIVREEMKNIGAIEIYMSVIQPAHLWKKSGRWEQYGSELLRLTDRVNRSFVLGPTHEEVITNLISTEIFSYKQLPLNVFQIQTKFRDEIRPRSGLIRSREFLMKDAYSFHTTQASLQETYEIMQRAYSTIFTKIGLKYCLVQANTGTMGGTISHEFHVIVENGEENIVCSTKSNYAATIELVEAIEPLKYPMKPSEKMRLVDMPNAYQFYDLVNIYNIKLEKIVKVIIVHATKQCKNNLVALVIRGDHQLNKMKAEKLPQVSIPLTFASEEEIKLTLFDANPDSLGIVNLPFPLIIDRSVAVMSDFITSANKECKYFYGVNWERDIPLPEVADLRIVIRGDMSPDGIGVLDIKRGIEVAHTFQLGTKYSEMMNATVEDKDGRKKTLMMGCYGMGITRLIAAIIEQNNDPKGMVWPELLAPFNVAILPVNLYHSKKVRNIAEKIYKTLVSHGIEVLFDDREEHIGKMLTDMELIGIPKILVISDRHLDKEQIEYKNRISRKTDIIRLNVILDTLTQNKS